MPTEVEVRTPAVFDRLGSAPRGLTAAQARERLARHGANALPPPHRTPLALRFAAQFTDVFALLLLGAAGITFVAGLLSRPVDVGSLQLGVAILGVVLLNAVIGFTQEYSAERTVQTLQRHRDRHRGAVRGGRPAGGGRGAAARLRGHRGCPGPGADGTGTFVRTVSR